jgi:choline-sulfatase
MLPWLARRRPDVVWVCADDFTPDACSAYGNPLVRTPHIDRLAAGGVRFDRAFAAAPLSTPSRQAFFTGRYPRSIGVTLSPTPLPADEATLPARLRAAGYATAAFGKTHYYAPRRGDWDVCVDRVEHREWLLARGGATVPAGVPTLGPWRPFATPAREWLNADVLPHPAADAEMIGTFWAERAAEYLARPPRRPFFAYVSFYETHSSFWFPQDWPDRRRPDEFAAPPVEPGADPFPDFADLSDADRRGILAAYHTSAGYMDRNVGTVLDAVTRTGRDTLVLFTSDHGYLLGQHGLFEKHCCYDPAVRACLVVRPPGGTGRATAALVSLVDLFPTVLDYCGVPVPAGTHGRSLRPLIEGRTDAHRGCVFAEYCDNEEAMVRTDRWKLVYSTGRRRRRDGYARPGPLPGETVRLFDLLADPGETVDRSTDPACAAVRAELLARLVEHVRSTHRGPGELTGPPAEVLRRGLRPPEER